TTRGDKGTKPLIVYNIPASAPIFDTSGSYTIFDNIEVSSTQSTNNAFEADHDYCRIIRCKASGACLGFYAAVVCEFIACEANTMAGGFRLNGLADCFGCISDGAGTYGFSLEVAGCTLEDCIATGSGGQGFKVGAGIRFAMRNCTAYGNT